MHTSSNLVLAQPCVVRILSAAFLCKVNALSWMESTETTLISFFNICGKVTTVNWKCNITSSVKIKSRELLIETWWPVQKIRSTHKLQNMIGITSALDKRDYCLSAILNTTSIYHNEPSYKLLVLYVESRRRGRSCRLSEMT